MKAPARSRGNRGLLLDEAAALIGIEADVLARIERADMAIPAEDVRKATRWAQS